MPSPVPTEYANVPPVAAPPMASFTFSRYAAALWGAVVFLPVGMNYFAFFALLLAMLLDGSRRERLLRLRRHVLFFPLAAFVAWTLITLALQRTYYPETPSNLMHGLRIALTWMLAMALTSDEALWAMRGFLAGAAAGLLIIAVGHSVGLPDWGVWRKLLEYGGNKSISNALMFALLGGSAVVVAQASGGRVRRAAIAVAPVLLAVIVLVLPNRTSLLVFLAAAPLAALHQWRNRKRMLVAALAIAAAASALFVLALPGLHDRLTQGMAEARQGVSGDASVASWNVRVQMIRYTGKMVIERPLTGWGIGGWNEEWRRRVPGQISQLNMPHNDLLWMGAQAGIPGALSWLAILLVACWSGWRRRDLVGRLAFVAAVSMLGSALVNSATRDAVIGLSLFWVVGVYVSLASKPEFEFSRLWRARAPIA